MAKRMANKALLISVVMVVLLPIVLISRASGEGNQNHTKLRVSVTGNKSGATQPVAGADVLVRSKTGQFEETARTDSQGNADISNVPFGKTLIQVTAPGWNNHGQTHELNKKELTIQVQLTSTGQENPTPTPTPTSTPTPAPTPSEEPAG